MLLPVHYYTLFAVRGYEMTMNSSWNEMEKNFEEIENWNKRALFFHMNSVDCWEE